jgi:hypothetical protein
MTPEELINDCEDKALKMLLLEMANKGFTTNTLDVIKQNINQTSYEEFGKLIAKSLNIAYDKLYNDTRLHDYISDLSKDITHQFNSIRQLLLTEDLKFSWFCYTGSNLTTTRPFCLAMTEKQYFHQCEITKIIQGDFPEYEKQKDLLFEETENITGFYSNTNETNFIIYRGGYGCGHQIASIPDSSVPDNIKLKLYETKEYKTWNSNRI